MLVLQIIQKYGREQRESVTRGKPPRSTYRVHHGSTLSQEKGRCQYCELTKKENFTQRKCLDCPFTPSLCQTQGRDCHAAWHVPTFDEIRSLWFDKAEHKSARTARAGPSQAASTRDIAGENTDPKN